MGARFEVKAQRVAEKGTEVPGGAEVLEQEGGMEGGSTRALSHPRFTAIFCRRCGGNRSPDMV